MVLFSGCEEFGQTRTDLGDGIGYQEADEEGGEDPRGDGETRFEAFRVVIWRSERALIHL